MIAALNQLPVSCPSQNITFEYDYAIRDLRMKFMKGGMDITAALESARADADIMTLHFTAQFSMNVHLAECNALTAPVLAEVHGISRRGQKRPSAELVDGEAEVQELSKSQKKRVGA